MSNMSGATPMRLTLIVSVDVDPVAHGFLISRDEAEEIVLRAINAAEGLQVDHAHQAVAS
jgi:hypothetical protein